MRYPPIALIVLLFAFCPKTATSAVVMSASTESANYVVREPVKVRVQIANETPDTIRLFPINELGNHMRHMFFEIARPSGAIEWRKFLAVFYLEVPGSGPPGEPLPPGGRIDLSLYPYMTYWIGPPKAAAQSKAPRFTFDEPGKYRVRVAYCVEPTRRYLWNPESGVLFSNSFELHLRLPSADERAILDAVWSGDRFLMSCGDAASHLKGDEEKLRAAIEQYGTSPLIRYARFALGRTLAYSSDQSIARQGIALLEEVSREFPAFRQEEIQLHRANALDQSAILVKRFRSMRKRSISSLSSSTTIIL